MTELDDLVRDLREVIRTGRDDNGTKAGMLAGLLATGPAQLSSEPGANAYHHAGYLSGHLLRRLLEHGYAADGPFGCAAAGYAAALADPAGQAALAKPDRPITAHIYAAMRCEDGTRQALAEAEERVLFDWLLEQTGTPPSPDAYARLERLRLRRQARLGLS
jgi:hypothetical protein